MKIFRPTYYFLTAVFCCFLMLSGYTKTDKTPEPRPFEEEKWKEATKNLDYTEEPEEVKKNKKDSSPLISGQFFEFLAGVFNIVAVIVAFFILAYLVYLLAENYYFEPRRQKASRDVMIENLEDYIHDIDLDALLAETLKNENYKLAIRIQYLMVIKLLSNQNLIRWKRQKTNGEYLSEIFGNTNFTDFQKATGVYERVWFGDVNLDKEKYNLLQPGFSKLIARLTPKILSDVK